MAAKRKPEPRVVSEVCSLCGLDWELHGKEPTTETCIELLLAEVRSLNAQLASRPYARPWPVPYPQPYPVPYPIYPRPVYPTITWSGAQSSTSGGVNLTPQLSNTAPQPVLVSK